MAESLGTPSSIPAIRAIAWEPQTPHGRGGEGAPSDFESDRWFLCGGLRPGIGRTWLAWTYHLSHVEAGEAYTEATPSQAKARRWIREALGVPVRFGAFESGSGFHVYCLQKYVEQVPSYDEATESWA